MAIATTSVWEMRTTGSNTNGGFYKSDAGTTDYSQQDAAQLSLSDIASDGAGTGISSATGGFTAQMPGNGIFLDGGTGFIAGWYEITAHTDTNNITIDRSAGASKTGGTGNVGGAVTLMTDALLETFNENNILWVKAGTYTLTGSISLSRNGDEDAIIKYLGYNATRGDEPTGDSRPLIACGSNTFTTGLYYHVKNWRMTGTAGSVLFIKNRCLIYNLKIVNSSGSGTRDALFADGVTLNSIYNNELVSTNGEAIDTSSGARIFVVGNYIHDSLNGIDINAQHCSIVNNIIDTCSSNGISIPNNSPTLVINNTIYNCDDGIEFAVGTTGISFVLNNIISDCTTYGINDPTNFGTRYNDYNNFHNNGTDINNGTKGDNTTSDDPEFTDAPNGDFTNTLAANATPATNFPGALTDNSLLQGAVQTSGAGGGGETSYGSVC